MQGKIDKISTIKQRIFQFIGYKGITKTEFFRTTGLNYNNFKGPSLKSDPGAMQLVVISTAYPEINLQWLLHGVGEITTPHKGRASLSDTVCEDSAQYTGGACVKNEAIGRPYYNVDFAGGFNDFLDNPAALPDSKISMYPYDNTNCVWCNLTGKSMEPAIMSGDKIAIKPVGLSDVIYGKIYAIVTKNGMRTVKHVVRSSDPESIRLIPENKDPMFGDYQDLKIADIQQIFEVLASVRMFQ